MTPELALLTGIAVGALIVFVLMRYASVEWKAQAKAQEKSIEERAKFSRDMLKCAMELQIDMVSNPPGVPAPSYNYGLPTFHHEPTNGRMKPEVDTEIRRVKSAEEVRQKIMDETGFDPRATTNPHFEE